MGKKLLHTPEGVRDIYGEEYAKKLAIQDVLHKKVKSFGFCDIQTPTIEFFDVFSNEIGTTPSKDLYKFFDKDGNTLVLRPDFTPSMARCAAKYFVEEDMPIRFCYAGNTFTNTTSLQGKLKEVTQMGAELIGDDSVEADAEMICLVIESLLASGLQDFQVSIGQVEFFKGICEEVGLPEETELELRTYISHKNYFGAEELLINHMIDKDARDMILKVTDMFGSIESLSESKNFVSNQRSLNAIRHLEKIYELLKMYQVEQYVTFDLGMLSKYNYYTGVIFKGYTYGIGDAIVNGGRYNNLLERFGFKAPAIGFMTVIDDLMEAIRRQNITVSYTQPKTMILYHNSNLKDALHLAKSLRNKEDVELVVYDETKSLEIYLHNAKLHLATKLILIDNTNSLKEYEVKHNDSSTR